MHRGKPSPYLARAALTAIRKEMGLPEVPATMETVSIDATLLLIAGIDKMRFRMRSRSHKYDLDGLILAFCARAPVPIDRQFIYGAVIVRYYQLVSQKNSQRRWPRAKAKKAGATEVAPD